MKTVLEFIVTNSLKVGDKITNGFEYWEVGKLSYSDSYGGYYLKNLTGGGGSFDTKAVCLISIKDLIVVDKQMPVYKVVFQEERNGKVLVTDNSYYPSSEAFSRKTGLSGEIIPFTKVLVSHNKFRNNINITVEKMP